MTEPAPDSQSGLRDPVAAVRGVGAAALVVMALVLLLAISPLLRMAGDRAGPAVWLVVGLAVLAGVLAGLLRRRWAWRAAVLVPLGLLLGGFAHWSLAALGVVFGALWAYVLHVRRTVLASGGSPTASA